MLGWMASSSSCEILSYVISITLLGFWHPLRCYPRLGFLGECSCVAIHRILAYLAHELPLTGVQ